MCRLMLALLGKGTLEGATILRPETLQQMESRQFEAHAALNAVGLVLMQYDTNSIAAWGHGGDTIAFHSDFWVVPDAQFGFFISYNSAMPRPGGGRGEVLRALFDRYFPKSAAEDSSTVDRAVALADGRAVAGTYETSRRAESTFLKVAAMFGQPTVRPGADGTITVDTSKNLRGQLKRWREIAPLVYREIDGPEKIAFRRDANGRVVELMPQPPIFEEQRTVWYENKALVMPVIGGSIGLLVLTILLWPVASIVRRRYQRPLFTETRDRLIFALTRIVCLLVAVWIAVLLVLSSRAGTDISLLGEALNPWLQVLHLLGWAIAAGTIVLVIAAVQHWRVSSLGLWARAHSTLLAVAGVIFVWFAWHCHLLEPSLKF
jgi:hypothetical protein